MKCPVCEREFAPQRKTRKFCSDLCRIKNHRPSTVARYNLLARDYKELSSRYDELYEVAEKMKAALRQLKVNLHTVMSR